jgi:hypothetical protein
MIGLIAIGGIMSRLIQFFIIAVSLTVLSPAQAALNFKTGLSNCQVLAAEASDEGKKKETDKKEGEEEEEEEEPDCD